MLTPAGLGAWTTERAALDGAGLDAIGPCRERLLGDATHAQLEPPADLVCITLYNEPLAALQATLRSLIESAARPGAPWPTLCIVADGIDRLDPAVLEFLLRHGYAEPVLQVADGDAVMTSVFHSLHRSSEWIATGEEVQEGGVDEPLRFIVCLKHANRGKLHSHALFFGLLCPRLEPRRCYQIDAGTVVAPTALRAVADHFRRESDVGALATRVGVAAPAAGDGLLARWQHMDFALQLAAHWPAEIASGHLSVVPGQFCAFRWAALTHPAHDSAASPLARYLRGTAPAGPMERVMFLAEDRVIGNEIVLAPGRPRRLDYCVDAAATTDACASLPELLRQRRRWNNCSFACRLWLMRQTPRVLGRDDRSAADKLRFVAAMLWQALLSLQQVAAPASVGSMLLAIGLALRESWLAGHVALTASAMAAALALLPLALWTPRAATPGARRFAQAHAAVRDGVAALSVALLVAATAPALGAPVVTLLFGPGLVLALLPARRGGRGSLRHAAEFVAVNGWMQTLLWGYALARLHDTSWGTKGLVDAPSASGASALRQMRRRWVAAALALNAALLAAAVALPGLGGAASNPVAEGFGLVSAAAVALALLGRVALRRRRAVAAQPGPHTHAVALDDAPAATTRRAA